MHQKPEPLEFSILGPNKQFKLFAFLLREKGSVPHNIMEHLELTFGRTEEDVEIALLNRYGRDLEDMDIKLVGTLPADSLITPVVEDLYSDKWMEKQRELKEAERRLPAARKKAFIQHLKTSNDVWGPKLGKKDHAELTRLIGKMEKVA